MVDNETGVVSLREFDSCPSMYIRFTFPSNVLATKCHLPAVSLIELWTWVSLALLTKNDDKRPRSRP